MQGHRAEIYPHEHHGKHHKNSKQCIKVIGNSLHENGQSVLSLYKAADSRRPGRNRGDDTDRRRSCINQISKFGLGNIVPVCYGAHYTSHSQTVEIIVYKNQDSQNNGGNLGTDSGFDVLSGPFSKGCRASGPVHHTDHSSQNHQENQNSHIGGIRKYLDKTFIYDFQHRSFKLEVCGKQSPY